MRRSKLYYYNGESRTVAEWAKETGICLQTLKNRLYHGWPIGEALTRPVQVQRQRERHRTDHTGERHGMLRVVKCVGSGNDGKGFLWLCQCACGGERIVPARLLRSTFHCGCRTKRRKAQPPTHDQPCWTCRNYAGGCSWSRKEPPPVDGWIATPVTKYNGARPEMNTFAIHFCPEYVPDGTEDRNDE